MTADRITALEKELESSREQFFLLSVRAKERQGALEAEVARLTKMTAHLRTSRDATLAEDFAELRADYLDVQATMVTESKSRSALEEEVARLTKERDEARAKLTLARDSRAFWKSASSQENQRVKALEAENKRLREASETVIADAIRELWKANPIGPLTPLDMARAVVAALTAKE